MSQLKSYIQTVLSVLLLAVVVDLLVPPRSGRYVRLVMGLVMAMAVLGPVLELLGSDLEAALRRWDLTDAVAPTMGGGGLEDPTVILWERALIAQVVRHADAVLGEMGLGGSWEAGAAVKVSPGDGQPQADRVDVVITGRVSTTPAVDPVKVAVARADAGAVGDAEQALFRRLLLARTGLDPAAVTVVWRGGGW